MSLIQGLSLLSEFYGWALLGTMVLFMEICVGFHLTPTNSHAHFGFFLFLNTFRVSSSVLLEDFVNLFGYTNYGLCFIFVMFE